MPYTGAVLVWPRRDRAAGEAATRRPLLLLVSGAPACGKSTLAARLADEFGLPLFSKDFFKEALFDTVGAPTGERSRELSSVAYDLLYRVAGQLLRCGLGVVLESNFVRGRSEAELGPLAQGARAVLLHCRCQRDVIVYRYHRRAISGERHPGHHDSIALPGVLAALDAGVYEPLALDVPTLTIDTTDGYVPEFAAIDAFIRKAAAI